MAKQLGMRGADVMRAGISELGLIAIAIEHADCGHAVAAGANDVVAAVADHDGVLRIDFGLGERVAEQVALVDARAVELGAEHALEIRLKAKMLDDAGGVDGGLA